MSSIHCPYDGLPTCSAGSEISVVMCIGVTSIYVSKTVASNVLNRCTIPVSLYTFVTERVMTLLKFIVCLHGQVK